MLEKLVAGMDVIMDDQVSSWNEDMEEKREILEDNSAVRRKEYLKIPLMLPDKDKKRI